MFVLGKFCLGCSLIKNFHLLLLIFLLSATVGASEVPKGNLEVPANGGRYSGIASFSGWACHAETIEILIDGSYYITPPWGSDRADTLEVCGKTKTGFSYLINLATLGEGGHQAVLFADGQEIDKSDFHVTRLSTGEFATGLDKCSVITDFPAQGSQVELNWSEATQNFEISSETPEAQDARLNGKWQNDFSDLNVWIMPDGSGEDCAASNLIYVTGYLGVNNDVPQKMHLAGEGSNGQYVAESLYGDSANRVVSFELDTAGRLKMTVESCTFPANCDRTKPGSLYIFEKRPSPIFDN